MNTSLKLGLALLISVVACVSLIGTKTSSAAVPVAPTLAALASVGPSAPVLVVEPILEIDDDTLTAYVKDAATNVQNARPAVANRGVNIDGSVRACAPLGWAIAGNPFGSPVLERNVSGLRPSTGTYTIEDVDMALPIDGTMPFVIGRTFNTGQDDSGSHFDSTQSFQGVDARHTGDVYC